MTLGACGGESGPGTREPLRRRSERVHGGLRAAVGSFSAISGDILGRAYEEQGWCASLLGSLCQGTHKKKERKAPQRPSRINGEASSAETRVAVWYLIYPQQ